MFQILNFVVFKIAGYLIVQTRFGINKISDSEIEKMYLNPRSKKTLDPYLQKNSVPFCLPIVKKKQSIFLRRFI
ncbi:hypothetical protein AAX19_03245 [Oenococcus oeni]|nr:hypothetical protein AAX19_03245 [Oenococcus oeni]